MARDRAAAARTMVAEGRNPTDERKKDNKVTFRAAAEVFLETKQDPWRDDKHLYQRRMMLGLAVEGVERTVFYRGNLLDRPVGEITTETVRSLLLSVDDQPPIQFALKPCPVRITFVEMLKLLRCEPKRGWRNPPCRVL